MLAYLAWHRPWTVTMLCIITIVLFIARLFIISSFGHSIVQCCSACGVVCHAGQGRWLVGCSSLGHSSGHLLCGCHVTDSNVASPVRGWSEKAHAGLPVLAQTLDGDDVVHHHCLPLHCSAVHFVGLFVIRCSTVHFSAVRCSAVRCPVMGRLVWGLLVVALHRCGGG